jgi:hypothetical protein
MVLERVRVDVLALGQRAHDPPGGDDLGAGPDAGARVSQEPMRAKFVTVFHVRVVASTPRARSKKALVSLVRP